MFVDAGELNRAGYSLSRAVCQTELIHIVQELGPVRVDPRSPELVRDIRPQSADSAKTNTLSSRYGTDAFPFHTDTAHWDHPARYLALYCVDPGEGRRPTLLQDSQEWRLNDAEKDLACRSLWKTGHVRPRLCTVGQRGGDYLTIRYDKDCMQPMTAEARDLEAIIDLRISRSAHKQVDWEPQSLLVIDNQRMVHARGMSSRIDSNRVLKRILIGGG
jgi:L-asparagine oxygenase